MSHTCSSCGGWKSNSARLCQDCRSEKLADRKDRRIEKRDKQRAKLEAQREKIAALKQDLKVRKKHKVFHFRDAYKEMKERGIDPNSEEAKTILSTYLGKQDLTTQEVTKIAKAWLASKYGYRLEGEVTVPNGRRKMDLFFLGIQLIVVGEVKTRYGDAKKLPTQLLTYYQDIRKSYSQPIVLYGILDLKTYEKIINKDYAVFDVLTRLNLPDAEIKLLIVNPDTNEVSELRKTT